MSWNAIITDSEGNKGSTNWHICVDCFHNEYAPKLHGSPCYLPKTASAIGNLLTSVDTGADGYMASGMAILKCNGFTRKEVAANA